MLNDLRQKHGIGKSTRTHLINRGRVRCQRFGAAEGARRENILHGSLTDEQRCRSGKDRQPIGLSSGGRLAALLLSYRTVRLCSFVAPCQLPVRANRTHSIFMRWVLVGQVQSHCLGGFVQVPLTTTWVSSTRELFWINRATSSDSIRTQPWEAA